MDNAVAFFVIQADDVARARAFYERCFGWKFVPWGPPGFLLIEGAGIRGALEKRQTPLTGDGFRAFECTVSVPNVAETEKAVVAAGGEITMPRATIPTVGTMIKFTDPEGNHLCAMQYEAGNP